MKITKEILNEMGCHAVEFATWMTDARIEEFYRVELGYEYWIKEVWPNIGEGMSENLLAYESIKQERERRRNIIKELGLS